MTPTAATARSLAARAAPLAAPAAQVRLLEETSDLPAFDATLARHALPPLAAGPVTVLQINVGKLCNQTCRHCHVDAGPDRKEVMTRATMELCLAALDRAPVALVDVTGGAPELNPHFRWLVAEVRRRGIRVMDRCNLTVLLLESQKDLAGFLAEHEVQVVASLPYFLERETDAQRGGGVFARSIEALCRLNALGYGREGSGLLLDLVYNPVGAFLPPSQAAVERDFRRELLRRHQVSFNRLYTITNMPISRFLEFLVETGSYERYMQRLIQAFNPAAVEGLMCRYTLSVAWDGTLHDCDFNQMLALGTAAGAPRHVRDLAAGGLEGRPIVTGRHCFGCTAGSGSSCGGATT